MAGVGFSSQDPFLFLGRTLTFWEGNDPGKDPPWDASGADVAGEHTIYLPSLLSPAPEERRWV